MKRCDFRSLQAMRQLPFVYGASWDRKATCMGNFAHQFGYRFGFTLATFKLKRSQSLAAYFFVGLVLTGNTFKNAPGCNALFAKFPLQHFPNFVLIAFCRKL